MATVDMGRGMVVDQVQRLYPDKDRDELMAMEMAILLALLPDVGDPEPLEVEPDFLPSKMSWRGGDGGLLTHRKRSASPYRG